MQTMIVANWKMNKLRSDAVDFLSTLTEWVDSLDDKLGEYGVGLAIAPPATLLDLAVESNVPACIMAQTMHEAEFGAFTGEISAPMLADLGVGGVVLGHSERRQYFNETDVALDAKVLSALRHRLFALLCVGESLDERNAGQAEAVVRRQLATALRSSVDAGATLPWKRLMIAYEPVWAIGTGEAATPKQAQQMHEVIRAVLNELLPEHAATTPILYGGSVKPENAKELLSLPDVNGALIGGAALDVDSYIGIAKAGMVVGAAV